MARFIPTKPIAQQIPLLIVAIESIFSLITTQGWFKISFIDHLPLKQHSLEWFHLNGFQSRCNYLGFIISYFVKQDFIVYQKEDNNN